MAIDSETRKWFERHFEGNVKFDEPMSRHTSFRVGGPADVFILPRTVEELIMLIDYTRNRKMPCRIIGDGTNILVKDKGIRGVVAVMTRGLKKISHAGMESGHAIVTAMAGARMNALCRYAIENGFSGMNFALGIPGTVGGGIMVNAGTSHGSIADILDSIVVLLPNGKTETILRKNLDYSYRNLVMNGETVSTCQGDPLVLEGNFHLRRSDPDRLKNEADEILKKRNKSQPSSHSAGCFFKNPGSGKTAGELIDLAGLKGEKIGDARVSEKHANFIINTGSATANEIIDLMTLVQRKVLEIFNITLEPEVKIVG